MDSISKTRIRFKPNVSSTSPQQLPRRPPRRRHVLSLRRRGPVSTVTDIEEYQKGIDIEENPRQIAFEIRFHDRHSTNELLFLMRFVVVMFLVPPKLVLEKHLLSLFL